MCCMRTYSRAKRLGRVMNARKRKLVETHTSHVAIGPIKELEVVSTPVRSAEESEMSIPLVLTPAVLSLNQDQREQAPLSQ